MATAQIADLVEERMRIGWSLSEGDVRVWLLFLWPKPGTN